jgi:hypothetical protein
MKFGLIKSKIERCLIESYKKDSFKTNMFVFNELVLENKNLSKLYFLYDELSTNKGLNESLANELINQSVVIYENTINKISKNDINDLNLWLSEVKTKNNYEHIDNLFSNNVLTLENKIKSKNIIVENLRNSPVKMEGTLNLPVKKLVDVANKTVNNFLESLNENSKKTLIKILSENEDKLKLKYEVLKETVVDKLEELKEIENETEVISRINETIGKIQKEKFDRINYFKLQELYKNI